jgi:hypothetical protein
LKQQIAREVRKPRRVGFHFVSFATQNRIFMTFRAGIAIEQRAETPLRIEPAQEDFLPALERGPFVRRKSGQWLSQFRWGLCLTTAHCQTQCHHTKDEIRFHRLFPFEQTIEMSVAGLAW